MTEKEDGLEKRINELEKTLHGIKMAMWGIGIATLAYFGVSWTTLTSKVDDALGDELLSMIATSVDENISNTIKSDKFLDKLPGRKFGERSLKSSNEVHQALTDGFVYVVSGGQIAGRKASVKIGGSIDNLRPRCRTHSTASYDGMVCPIAQNEYWMVDYKDGTFQIEWMPIVLQ
ncbi:MAG: hypothetical protein ACI9SP_004361 [Arenicella sp.]|jgi:hypothetical protein